MQDFEKLGEFYLGKTYDLPGKTVGDELILYDSKDLTTHAVCVGMTGSGKTGLCLSLLEEAAIDGIPVIAIDPKGDLGNLLLTFPELRPEDFRPWIDDGAALRAGLTPDQFAEQTATRWREGLAAWGQSPERIARFRNAVDLAIYTPGATAGLPLTVMRSFAAPAPEVLADPMALRDRIASAASGLLALLGIDADPVQSREHILLSNLMDRAWRQGQDLDLARLIQQVQAPPINRLGVIDLETFFPEKERVKLAMSLNNLLASPSFASWMEGEPLDVKRLLHTAEGKPRLSILSIAHLSDTERMFFVTLLLNEVLAWVRTQEGTTSLRAILYMDEVFGYFPPVANPPSKTPMLTLLKQARAYGLGIVLATQNPVDLDYKGLSNTGTWFLGRLQTERDKARVLEGLEGAAAQTGAAFDRAAMEQTLAGLSTRVFLMNNVHEDAPVVFQTRWALSYLRGPLTTRQIETLMKPHKQTAAESAPQTLAAKPTTTASMSELKLEPNAPAVKPVVPPSIEQVQLLARHDLAAPGKIVYRPALWGQARLHFVQKSKEVDEWRACTLLQPLGDRVGSDVWEGAEVLDPAALPREQAPQEGLTFAPLPDALISPKNYEAWKKQLAAHLYATEVLSIWRCAKLKMESAAGEAERDFRIRLTQHAREKRDLEVEKLRKSYASKASKLEKQVQTSQKALAKEKSQSRNAKLDTAATFGSTLLGALFGRKLASRSNVDSATRSVRKWSKASEQHEDVDQAEATVRDRLRQLADLDAELHAETERIRAEYDVNSLELEEVPIRPRKTDVQVKRVALAWVPWRLDDQGQATRQV
jgi:hypothetical protein